MRFERDLHDLGYRYTGEGNLYQLTWVEIMNLVEAAVMKSDEDSGIRKGDLGKLDKLHKKLAQKGK